LKNARVDIKDLASQMFTLEENISLGEYIQSIEENKIKLKQINSGTEVKIYIPIKLKNEDYVNMKKLQEGVELILTTTYVDSEGSEEILESMRKGYVNYVINTRNIDSMSQETDGVMIRRCSVENNIPIFTALDTVRVLLDVLEEITLGISTIDE